MEEKAELPVWKKDSCATCGPSSSVKSGVGVGVGADVLLEEPANRLSAHTQHMLDAGVGRCRCKLEKPDAPPFSFHEIIDSHFTIRPTFLRETLEGTT